jgi:biotin transport system substrate-specific component
MFYTHAQTEERSALQEGMTILLASFIIAISGHISVPLWFTPVPLAAQSMVVLLMSAILGSRRGAAATFAFLFQGALGLPVFSIGVVGAARFFSPTGGYLIGYLIASFVTGALIERTKEKTTLNYFWAMLAGNGVIYLCGASYLATFVGIEKALVLGVAPFVVGDLLKIGFALKILRWIP